MKAYSTYANMTAKKPIDFEGKLVKKVAAYFEPGRGKNSEVWETDTEFDFKIAGKTIKTNKITIYK